MARSQSVKLGKLIERFNLEVLLGAEGFENRQVSDGGREPPRPAAGRFF